MGAQSVTLRSDLSNADLSSGCYTTLYSANYFAFTPTQTGQYSIDTCSSATSADTFLSVVTDCNNPAGGSFGIPRCINNGCYGLGNNTLGSSLAALLTAGTTYYIALGGSQASLSSTVTLTIGLIPYTVRQSHLRWSQRLA